MWTRDWAAALAEWHLATDLPRRWVHVQAVAAPAAAVSAAVPDDRELSVSAAWLHDIGYAPALLKFGMGFHPLDGATFVSVLAGESAEENAILPTRRMRIARGVDA
jgi:HD superfamily phosphodiesterase